MDSCSVGTAGAVCRRMRSRRIESLAALAGVRRFAQREARRQAPALGHDIVVMASLNAMPGHHRAAPANHRDELTLRARGYIWKQSTF